MEFILFIQKLTCDFLDWFFIFFTLFGEELMFVVIVSTIYWCISKDYAFKLVLLYIISAGINQLLKITFKRQRPEGVRKLFGGSATSYSFPSGHSQASSLYVSALSREYGKNKLYYILGVVLVFLVMLSRIYLGHHYLTDVLAGGSIGYCLGYFVSPLLKKININKMWYTIAVIPCVIIQIFSTSHTVSIAVGGLSAIVIGYVINSRYIKTSDRASTKTLQALRLVVGFAIVGVTYLLMSFLPYNNWFGYLTFFVLGLEITALVPLIHKIIENNRRIKSI